MIGKSSLGAGFKSLGKYLEFGNKANPERVEWLSIRNLPKDMSIEDASKLMQATANQNTRAIKPLYHLSLSWDKSDNVTQESMKDTVDKVIKELGLGDNQALIVSHKDTEHKHLHVMVNRINPNTLKASSMSNEKRKVQKVLRQEELEKGFRQVKGALYSLDGKYADISREKEFRKVIKNKSLSFNDLVREVAVADFRASKDWKELENRLSDKGLSLVKKGRGLVITDGSDYMKCSSLERGFSLNNLEKRFGSYYEQNIERESGRSSAGIYQGEDRSAIERDSGVDFNHEQRSVREFPENSRSNSQGRESEIDRKAKNDFKGVFNSISNECAIHPPDSRVCEWERPLKHLNINVLKQKQTELSSLGKKFDKIIDMFDEVNEAKNEREQELKLELEEIYRKPEAALAEYNKVLEEAGIDKANEIMTSNPKQYGRLCGMSFFGLKNKKRQNSLEKAFFTSRKMKGIYYAGLTVDRKLLEYEKAKKDLSLNKEREWDLCGKIVEKERSMQPRKAKSRSKDRGFEMDF